MVELEKIISHILSISEKELKIADIVYEIINDIESNLETNSLNKDYLNMKISNIKNIIQIMDKSKYEWEFFTLKEIVDILKKIEKGF